MSKRSSDEKPLGTVSIPYVSEVSEKFKRISESSNSRIVFKQTYFGKLFEKTKPVKYK
jgi:hypothetical protein